MASRRRLGADFLRKRPTSTKHCQAWSKRMSGPPASFIFAPFGSKSRLKALLERRLKNVSTNMRKSNQTLPKWSPKRVCVWGSALFCYFWAPKRHPGARRCPEVPRTHQNLHFGTQNQQFIQHAKKFIEQKTAYFVSDDGAQKM